MDRTRRADIFYNKDLQTKVLKYVTGRIRDVPNVYCQHKPHLFRHELPELLERGKDDTFPMAYLGLRGDEHHASPLVIVFQIGGTTFSESKEAAAYERARVIVGGTFVHNSRSFLGEMTNLRL